MNNIKGKYLITTTDWFFAPDGIQYRAVWGDIEILQDSILGIKTNSRSTNWYMKIGKGSNHVIVAGCQINYAVKTENKPNTEYLREEFYEGEIKLIKGLPRIYIAE